MNIPARTTSTTAIISLIFGIVCWMALPFIGALIAVISGHTARAEIRRAPPGTLDGDGMALTGLILGYLHIACFVFAVMILFMFLGGLSFFAHHFHG